MKYLLILLTTFMVGIGLYHFFVNDRAKVEIINGTPFNVLVSYHYQSHKDSTFTEGHYLVPPGEMMEFDKTFQNVSPNLKIYYRTAREDSELIRWYFDLPHHNKGVRDLASCATLGLIFEDKFPIWKSDNILDKQQVSLPKNPLNIATEYPNYHATLYVKFMDIFLRNTWWNWKNWNGKFLIKDESFLIDEYDGINFFSKYSQDVLLNKYSRNATFLRDSLMYEFEKPGILKLVNTLPHDIFFQYNYNVTKDSSVSVGWLPLVSGEQKRIDVLFRGTEPLFHIAVKTPQKDAELIRWWYNYPDTDNGILEYYYDTLMLSAKGEVYNPVSHINDSLCNSSDDPFEFAYYGSVKPGYRRSDSTYIHQQVIFNNDFRSLYAINDSIDMDDSRFAKAYFDKAKSARDTLTKLFVKKGEFEVTNTTPFEVYFVVSFPTTKDSVVTEGYWKLAPGESKLFNRTFYGIEPQINVYAETSSSDVKLIRKAFGLLSSHPGKIYYQPLNASSGVYLPIKPTKAFEYKTRFSSTNPPESDAFFTSFSNNTGTYHGVTSHYYYDIEKTYQNSPVELNKGQFLIVENRLPYVYQNESYQDDEEAVENYIQKSKSLRSSFLRRVRYDELMSDSYPSGEFPYILGVYLEPRTSDNFLGIKVSGRALATNVLGGSMPFNEGDIITSFDDTPIYSVEDLKILLHDHALNLHGGIANPIPFELARDDELITGKTLYFFNPNFPWKEIPWWKKTLWGLMDAALYGFDDELYESLTKDDPWEGWQYVQDKSRLVQFSDRSYFVGNIGGIFISPGRFLVQNAVKKQVVKLGMKKGIASLATTVVLEGGEAVVWSYGNRSPVLSQQQFLNEMKDNVLLGVGIGVIAGSFSLKRKW